MKKISFLTTMFLFGWSMTASAVTLMVTPLEQPQNTVFVNGAARVPFVSFSMKAVGGDIPVYSIGVTKTGTASAGVLEDVYFLAGAVQIGKSVDLELNPIDGTYRAVLFHDAPFMLYEGVETVFDVVGNASADLSNDAGKTIGLALSMINVDIGYVDNIQWPGWWTDGAVHTVNSTLEIGSITAGINSLNLSQQQVTVGSSPGFASFDVICSGVEDCRWYSLIYKEIGTSAPSDLTSHSVKVGQTKKDSFILPDGRFYVWDMDGIIIPAGESLRFTVEAKVAGGVGRTVRFQIWEPTDLEVYGEVYGFGLTPKSGNGFSSTTPWFQSGIATIVAPPLPPPPPTLGQRRAGAMAGIPLLLLKK